MLPVVESAIAFVAPRRVPPAPVGGKGVAVAMLVLLAWTGLLAFLLAWYRPNWYSPAPYLLVLLQTHFYTGLFITAHDAMHGVVRSEERRVGKECEP